MLGLLRRVLLSVAVALAIATAPAAAQYGPPTVTVARPLAKSVAQWDEYTGRFEAVARVDVRPRVSGYIDQVHFVDGADVQQGQLLFTIDQRPFKLAVQSAEADLEKAQAQVVLTTAEYQRASKLVQTAATPVSELDQRKADLESARAQVLSAQAALNTAQLNLEWSEVRAPLAGRVSDRRVDPGNLVSGGQTDATLLTTIVKLDPIYFVFDGSEADYIRYMRLNTLGKRMSSRSASNPVEVRLADETNWPHHGAMDFVDNEINAHTGTIRGRAVLPNPDHFLTPGTFGRLRLYGGSIDALLVPDDAISSDQAQKILLVVGPDNKVVARPVELGAIALGLRVVLAGLKPDDRVIITGLANPMVRPGSVVVPQPGEIKPPQASPQANAAAG